MEQALHDRNEVLGDALKASIALYGLKKKDVEQVLGVSKRQLQLMQENGVDPDSKTGELVKYFIRIIRGISAMTGREKSKANHWLTTNNKAFSGISPLERMKTIEGLIDVLRYCDAFRGKL